MSILEKLMALLTGGKPANEENLVNAEVCPNCWGKQEYDNEVRDVVNDRSKTPHEKKAFVAKFVETHVTGIALRHEDDKLVCPACDGVYKNSRTNTN